MVTAIKKKKKKLKETFISSDIDNIINVIKIKEKRKQKRLDT